MLHVVIPAAGSGRRFAEAGYTDPKPLIDVLGVPMVQRVIENVTPTGEHRVTVVSQVPLPGVHAAVMLTDPTGGAVESILRADIGPGPLLIANCDQLTSLNVDDLVQAGGDGALATFRSSKPHHSYLRLDGNGHVVDIAEKIVISDRALAGVYYFADGSAFADAARHVVEQDIRVWGELYVSTVIAEMVGRGAQLSIVDTDVAVMGTPEELEAFLAAARVARAAL